MSALVLHGVPVHVRHDRPPVEAVAVVDGRVTAAGSLAEATAAAPGATVRRLPGGAVLPAFVDPHQHAFLVAADPMVEVLRRCAPDVPGLLAVLRTLVATLDETLDGTLDGTVDGTVDGRAAPEPGGWLRFHGYEPLALAEHRSPTAAELDRVTADRPLHVLARTYHESVVNSAGLAALGITATTPDPPGGRIVRDRRGRATGVLLESASFLAEARSRPVLDADVFDARLAAHGRRLLALGITRIGDAATPATAAARLRAVLAAVGVDAVPLLTGHRIDTPAFVAGGTAKVLVDGGEYCHLCMTSGQLARVTASAVRAGFGPDRALARSLGRRTGTPRRGADGRWHTGIRYPAAGRLDALVRLAADAGSRIALHAVGNGAVETVLRARAADHGLADAVPLRLEHAMALAPDAAARIADAGVPVVTQPAFLAVYGHDLEVTPVPAPLRLLPLRTMLDAGVDLALSSDHPAVPADPFVGVHAAVTRRDDRGRPVHPEEALTVAQALTACTASAARVLGAADAGTLEPGSPADIVWCDGDPHRVDPDDLAGIGVLATWSHGRLVHATDAAAETVGRAR
ncbi:amidohydrolase [Kineosporia sp. R_H_3]|uniref:amidohydrolase n=1 Tax=Kineosporia sp. R_H_3 TaxID=1961848 RepID=UPI000B4A9FCE|nr:amidohydrolase family protein [Kineosporia sp. R_H_3]